MTSRVSCFKLTVNNMKRRSWYGAVAFLGAFCGFPLMTMMRFQSVGEITKNFTDTALRELEVQAQQEQFLNYVGGGDLFLMMLISFLALLGAWSGMSWLHSRKKMDLMGSLPIRREKLFLAESLATLLLAMIPYVINMILALLVAAAKGIFTGRAAAISLAGLGIHLLYFILLYFCGTLAMLLTGKVLTGILGTGVLLAISPVIYGAVEAYAGTFLKTYMGQGEGLVRRLAVWLSPAGNFVQVTARMENYWTRVPKVSFPWASLAAALLMGLVFAGLTVWLLRIRKTESAEKAMAFPKTEGIIKAVLLYPMILGGGIFFQFLGNMDVTENYLWLWFGILFTALLGSILIEIIYYFDRKRIWSHKVWTGISLGAAIITAAAFVYDLIGYDHWLPKEEELEYAVINGNSVWWEYPDGSRTTADYLEKNIEKFKGDGVLELAREGVENLDITDWDGTYTNVEVYFQMKNGDKKKRSYMVREKTFWETEEKMYQEEVYKETVLPLLLMEPGEVQVQDINHFSEYIDMGILNRKEQEEFIRIYQEELRNLDYDQIYEANSSFLAVQDRDYNYMPDYPLNQNFKKSVAYLEDKGVDAVSFPNPDQVKNIAFLDYRFGEAVSEEGEMEADIVRTVQEKSTQDQELIEKALGNRENLICTGNTYENKIDTERLCMDLQVDITYENAKGDLVTSSWAYVNGTIPQEVEEFLEK